jgi:pseudouridine synthase
VERLQKVLAQAGIASRRVAERLIAEGRVIVNGVRITRLGTRVDPAQDTVRVDGRRIPAPPPAFTYLMLHKPQGVVTTLSDPQGRRTIRDLLVGVKGRVYPVGRLDFQSEGLLLLTNDGRLARDLMHPRSGVPKTYLAKLRGEPGPQELARLARGIVLDGKPTQRAGLRIVGRGRNAWIEIRIVEGRKHQVRRMLGAIGHPVVRLRRVAYAGVKLGKLAPGSLRSLTPAELARLRRAAGLGGIAGP